MAQTRKVALTENTWIAAVSGATYCTLQMQSNGPLKIAVGGSAPSSPNDPGIMFLKDELTQMSFFDLDVSDTIYVWCRDAGEILVSIDNGS